MIQPPALLLQQQIALKTARRVAVARGASFASRCMRLENSQRAKWGLVNFSFDKSVDQSF
jgi:hypothetical protein